MSQAKNPPCHSICYVHEQNNSWPYSVSVWHIPLKYPVTCYAPAKDTQGMTAANNSLSKPYRYMYLLYSDFRLTDLQ